MLNRGCSIVEELTIAVEGGFISTHSRLVFFSLPLMLKIELVLNFVLLI